MTSSSAATIATVSGALVLASERGLGAESAGGTVNKLGSRKLFHNGEGEMINAMLDQPRECKYCHCKKKNKKLSFEYQLEMYNLISKKLTSYLLSQITQQFQQQLGPFRHFVPVVLVLFQEFGKRFEKDFRITE